MAKRRGDKRVNGGAKILFTELSTCEMDSGTILLAAKSGEYTYAGNVTIDMARDLHERLGRLLAARATNVTKLRS